MWMLLSCLSALLLGCYDISKKKAVDGNAVLPTLFFSTLAGALCTAPLLALSALSPAWAQHWHVHIPPQPLSSHLLILLKSAIVGSSWVLSYFALKHLPLTIASPLRATGPLFTVLGAVLVFGERPSLPQWAGILLILASYFLYSIPSRRGFGGQPHPGPWILMMVAAAVTGAVSGGFDKHLLQTRGLPPLFVLGYFLPYLAALLGLVVAVAWYPNRRKTTPFQFRPSMLMIGVFLVAADLAYMTALSNPAAKLSVVSAIRRANVLISFAGGALLFRESESARKLLPFAGILIGLALLFIG